jgi:hypothetical protein
MDGGRVVSPDGDQNCPLFCMQNKTKYILLVSVMNANASGTGTRVRSCMNRCLGTTTMAHVVHASHHAWSSQFKKNVRGEHPKAKFISHG